MRILITLNICMIKVISMVIIWSCSCCHFTQYLCRYKQYEEQLEKTRLNNKEQEVVVSEVRLQVAYSATLTSKFLLSI